MIMIPTGYVNRESYEIIPLTTLGLPRSSGLGLCHEYALLGLDAFSVSWRSGSRFPRPP